jgi:uncharacterized protein YkwD
LGDERAAQLTDKKDMWGTGHAHRRILVVAILAAFALLALAGTGAAATVSQRNTVEPSLVTRINQVRADHHLSALKVASPLTTAATRHATNMAWKGYFRHEYRKDGKWLAFGTWIRWYWPGSGYMAWTAGENLAWAAPDATPAQVVKWWMDSPGHRANLLGAWNRVGVAVVHVSSPGGFYGAKSQVTIVAAEFGKRT